MSKDIIKLCIVGSLLFSSSLYSNDGFTNESEAFDDVDDFGGDEEIIIEKIETKKQNDFTSYGSITYSTNYSYKDIDDITSSKISTNLNFEYKLDENSKLKSTVKAYQDFESNIKNDRDIDINEIYLQSSLNINTDIKVGRQIVVWGKSDNIRITDTLNPLDMTTPGMVDIEDLRLGRVMSKIDYFMEKWSLTGIILHENRYSDIPKFGSEYTISNEMMYNNMLVKEPSNTIENSGIALSASANLEGQDIAFYYSNQYVDNTTYRSNMLGMGYNKVLDSFLFKTEFAYFDNYDSSTVESKLDGLVGLEYNGISEGSISFEMANKNDDIQYALRFTQSYLNQTLDFTALYSAFGKELEDGGFIRVWGDYDIDDKLSTSVGFINYIGGDLDQFNMIKDNDRVFASLKYSF